MGLDTSHGCWHGAYSAFMRWRHKIAEVAGFPPLGMMEGFYDSKEWWFMTPRSAEGVRATMYKFDELVSTEGSGLSFHAQQGLKGLPISWTIFEADPLVKLLYHSDCDGSIASADCGPIADRLTTLLPLLPDAEDGGHIGVWREKTQRFIDGLRAAAAAGEDVEFH